jgi:hypothetical protein
MCFYAGLSLPFVLWVHRPDTLSRLCLEFAMLPGEPAIARLEQPDDVMTYHFLFTLYPSLKSVAFKKGTASDWYIHLLVACWRYLQGYISLRPPSLLQAWMGQGKLWAGVNWGQYRARPETRPMSFISVVYIYLLFWSLGWDCVFFFGFT